MNDLLQLNITKVEQCGTGYADFSISEPKGQTHGRVLPGSHVEADSKSPPVQRSVRYTTVSSVSFELCPSIILRILIFCRGLANGACEI